MYFGWYFLFLLMVVGRKGRVLIERKWCCVDHELDIYIGEERHRLDFEIEKDSRINHKLAVLKSMSLYLPPVPLFMPAHRHLSQTSRKNPASLPPGNTVSPSSPAPTP
jgi:hypothetical protein